jgi:hypothetical protein
MDLGHDDKEKVSATRSSDDPDDGVTVGHDDDFRADKPGRAKHRIFVVEREVSDAFTARVPHQGMPVEARQCAE